MIELRSEEVQEVMGQIPPWILRYGITGMFLVLVVLLFGCWCFRYPETITAELKLTRMYAPIYVKAGSAGNLKAIYVTDKQPVSKGMFLGIIDNVASETDVFLLRERLEEWQEAGGQLEQAGRLFFRKVMNLGTVQSAYGAFLTAWHDYLLNMQVVRSHELALYNAVASLMQAASEWEKAYVLQSPVDGTVSFMQSWETGQPVAQDETVFVVVPVEKPVPMARVRLPMQSVGQVFVGQRAIIRLAGFSEQEYGILEGRVSFISPIPDEEGMYTLELELPDGLQTSNGKSIPLIEAMSGTADIVTKERNLLERLLMNR